ncbi:MAG: MobC family plasmid mobilization relaxosome protein, partial [Plesiomonas shigelloides]
ETRSTKSAKTPRIDPALLRQLSGLGNNLNQIARAINSHEWKPIDRIQIVAALTTIQRELALLKTENSHDR